VIVLLGRVLAAEANSKPALSVALQELARQEEYLAMEG
jgi:hypothetical protein